MRTFFSSLIALTLLVSLSAGAAHAAAKPYPNEPLRIIVHTKPGSPMDALMRLWAKLMEQRVPVPVVVENKPGGGSAVQTTFVATAKKPDYTIAAVSNTQVSTPLSNNTPNSLADMRPVSFLFEDPLLLVVKPEKPWKDAKDFFNDVKANPNKYMMGVAQVGSVDYLSVFYYTRNGYDYQVVPFDSGGETLTQLLGNHVDIAILEPSLVAGQIKAGKLRGLCSFTDQRLASLPDVPTITELGYPSVSMRQFRGMMLPKSASDEAAKYLHGVFQDILKNSAEFHAYCKANEREIKVMSTEGYAEYLKNITAETAKMLDSIGMLKK